MDANLSITFIAMTIWLKQFLTSGLNYISFKKQSSLASRVDVIWISYFEFLGYNPLKMTKTHDIFYFRWTWGDKSKNIHKYFYLLPCSICLCKFYSCSCCLSQLPSRMYKEKRYKLDDFPLWVKQFLIQLQSIKTICQLKQFE